MSTTFRWFTHHHHVTQWAAPSELKQILNQNICDMLHSFKSHQALFLQLTLNNISYWLLMNTEPTYSVRLDPAVGGRGFIEFSILMSASCWCR